MSIGWFSAATASGSQQQLDQARRLPVRLQPLTHRYSLELLFCGAGPLRAIPPYVALHSAVAEGLLRGTRATRRSSRRHPPHPTASTSRTCRAQASACAELP